MAEPDIGICSANGVNARFSDTLRTEDSASMTALAEFDNLSVTPFVTRVYSPFPINHRLVS